MIPARFVDKVDLSGPPPPAPYRPVEGPCWLWTASAVNGYGWASTTLARGPRKAHVVVYEVAVGPVPEGLELDHVCRVTLCVNPDHMEPVTHAENMRRNGVMKTHCKHGHEFTPENTGRQGPFGHRYCRTCACASSRASQARKRLRSRQA